MYKSIIFHTFLWLFALFRVGEYCNTYLVWNCTVDNKAGPGNSTLQIFSGLEEELSVVRAISDKKIKQNFPSPHSELLGGVLLGINDIKNTPTFNDVVRDVGTIHVIVVSGYNINLVFALVYRIIGSKYKARNTIFAITATLIYALISGFDPPVVRAWIMGAILGLGTYYGRKISAMQVLLFSGVLMVAVSPAFLFSLSFQLSFLAALGLVLYADTISGIFSSEHAIVADLSSTIAAQVLVWPLIAYHFERVSIISPLVNALVLWLIPLSTILGGVYLLGAFISDFLGIIFSFMIIVPLDLFIRLCYFFSNFPYSNVSFEPGAHFLLLYYLCILAIPIYLTKHNERKKSA